MEISAQIDGLIVTTDWVLVEVANALAESRIRHKVPDLIAHLKSNDIFEVIPATRHFFDHGLQAYKQYADKGWGLTDCISIVIMRERGMEVALTADKHFEQAGFTALLK